MNSVLLFLSVFIISNTVGFKEGDNTKGYIELVSGVASCIPGFGTFVGVTLDGGMAGHDFKQALENTSLPKPKPINYKKAPAYKISESDAYECLDLNPSPELTLRQVVQAYNQKVFLVHADQFNNTNDNWVGESEELFIFIADAKNLILKLKKW